MVHQVDVLDFLVEFLEILWDISYEYAFSY